MMTKLRNLSLLLFLFSCSDFDMGMRYQKILLAKKGNTSVYCYNLLWSAEAYFISTNNDVCMGFDSTKDYCYGRGHQEIYYKFENDTLKIFSYGKRPTIPLANKLNIYYEDIEDLLSYDKFEEDVKNKKISKVQFDSVYDLPCTVITRPYNLKNMKFK